MNNYEVTFCIVDFPMGCSPEYPHASNLTKEDAEAKASELNKQSAESNSATYRVYSVRQQR